MNTAILKKLSLPFFAALSLTLAGCGTETNNTNNGEGAGTQQTNENGEGAETVEFRDELNIAMTAQPPSLDAPRTASNVAINIAAHIFEPLFSMNENYEVTPDLALGYEVSVDGLVYTITLREGIMFHDGSELTAADAVASMNRWLLVNGRAGNALAGSVFEQVDDYTLTLTLEQPFGDVMQIMASRATFAIIMPEELALELDEDGAPAVLETFIGTGPYEFNEWRQDQFIHLTRFEAYEPRGEVASGFSGMRAAYTPNLFFHFVSDVNTRISGLRTGQFDIAEDIPFENASDLQNADGINLHTRNAGILNAFFNTTEGILSDPQIRHAILAGMNNEEIMIGGYSSTDYFTLNHGFTNPSQQQWAVDAGVDAYNQNNQDLARELLAASDYNGETIRLLTTRDYISMHNATVVLDAQLRALGFETEIINVDFPSFMERRSTTTDWDIFITSNGYNILPTQILALDPNWAGFDSEFVAQAIQDVRLAPTQEAATEAWAGLVGYVYENAAFTPIGHFKNAMATSDQVEGFVFFDHPVYWNARIPR
ncbi:MAG: ABC transporter substrate-binding protein [Turicibacter sp.]|nr:ABC transporter substrate-binding protein [Turicibacter sp.]